MRGQARAFRRANGRKTAFLIRAMAFSASSVLLAGVVMPLVSGSEPAAAAASKGTLIYYGAARLQSAFVFPSRKPNSPIVIFVHGGGFASSFASWKRTEVEELQSAGFTVFDANYDTDSTVTPAFPREPNDIVALTKYALRNGLKYNGDPRRLVLLGGSAGGTLAGLAAEDLNSEAHGTVKAVITLSSAFDFAQLPMDSTLETALGCLPSERVKCTTALKEKWSPADGRNIATGRCPAGWLVLNASHEKQPLAQAETMVNRLHGLRCSSKLIVNTSGSRAHAFDYWKAQFTNIVNYIRTWA